MLIPPQADFDMVISLLRNNAAFVSAVHAYNRSLPIALLALSKTELTSLDPRVDQNQRVNVHKRLMWEKAERESALLPPTMPQRGYPEGSSLTDAWIWPFLWQGNTSLFTGMFKLVEDRLNAHVDTQHGVQV